MNILCFQLCYVCWHALNVLACLIEVEYRMSFMVFDTYAIFLALVCSMDIKMVKLQY